MSAYYNEFDKFAAQWLRNLIQAGHIAPGDVDERSIEDVCPDDLRGYAQCHFFAGIGVWSYALRRAGWVDTRPVWTASCPCQPYSAAGKGLGFADERHLWPAFNHLASERRPVRIFGEQVASKDADPWIDLVHTDLEAMGYAFGAVAFPSASVGAPHIRDRTYWVADADDARLEGRVEVRQRAAQRAAGARGVAGRLADTDGEGRRNGRELAGSDDVSFGGEAAQRGIGWEGVEGFCSSGNTGPTNGIWRDADWLGCTDGKWRPVEPGTFPLAHGATSRVGRLRAYGNAVNSEQARIFIESVMECHP